jgi:hypothetical protein
MEPFDYDVAPNWSDLPAFFGHGLLENGLSSILPQLALLASWGVISFLVALKIFRWQ